MNELTLVSQVLSQIIDQNLHFSDALKNVVQQSPISVSQGLIRSLTSCELHHHRLLEHVVNRFVPNLSKEDRLYIQAAIGNNVFVRRLPLQDVVIDLQTFLTNRDIAKPIIDNLLALAAPGKSLIDPQVKENSIPYISIKFNTPEWLVLMWVKHFGFALTLKILATNNKPVLP